MLEYSGRNADLYALKTVQMYVHSSFFSLRNYSQCRSCFRVGEPPRLGPGEGIKGGFQQN